MRRFARLATILGLSLTLATATVGSAEARPSRFAVAAVHSAGAGATAGLLTGAMSWSTSLKTVTLSGVKLFVKGGECINFQVAGRRGSTIVTDIKRYPSSPSGGSYCPAADYTYSFGTISITADSPGGIEYVDFDIVDYWHSVHGWAVCDRDAAACTGANH
ncbi:hypothetical protein [Amycolatopsis sp. NPDC051128]|uniref:hypothetical protein n=1 Tax=Amycolatopsis sp. NPDC051128 TaxID=3155412 RepID=UPI003422FEF7